MRPDQLRSARAVRSLEAAPESLGIMRPDESLGMVMVPVEPLGRWVEGVVESAGVGVTVVVDGGVVVVVDGGVTVTEGGVTVAAGGVTVVEGGVTVIGGVGVTVAGGVVPDGEVGVVCA